MKPTLAKALLITVPLWPLCLTACDDGGGGGGETEGGMLGGPVEIPFAARIGDQEAGCGPQYQLGAGNTTVVIRDLRFFVSNVRLLDADGNEVPVTLDDNDWQHESVALLDFENRSGLCVGSTTEETNTKVVGKVPEGTYKGLIFDVGVPFELNHIDAANAPPPMNNSAMFWVWANGYKFMKIELTNSNEPPNNGWNFRLGSQGCDAQAADQPPTECTRPNRPVIALPDYEPGMTVVLDLAQLFADVDVSKDTPDTAPGCLSFGPDVAECRGPFSRLGLDWDTGRCFADCSEQTAFRVE